MQTKIYHPFFTEDDSSRNWTDNWNIIIPWPFGRKRRDATETQTEELARWFDGWTINWFGKRSAEMTPEELARWFDGWTINWFGKRSAEMTPEELARWFDNWTINWFGKRSAEMTPEELARWFDNWTINWFGKRSTSETQKRWLQNWTFNQGSESTSVSGIDAVSNLLSALLNSIKKP